MEPAGPPTERALCLQSGGIQAPRCEGNIHRSPSASTIDCGYLSSQIGLKSAGTFAKFLLATQKQE
jgi:hypothetical protein